jgi:hypothetical protein
MKVNTRFKYTFSKRDSEVDDSEARLFVSRPSFPVRSGNTLPLRTKNFVGSQRLEGIIYTYGHASRCIHKYETEPDLDYSQHEKEHRRH